jgi:hypothetical protein
MSTRKATNKRLIPISRDDMTYTDARGVKQGYHMRDAVGRRHRVLNQLIKRHTLLTVRRMLQARLNISRRRIDPQYVINAQLDLDWMKQKAEKKEAVAYGRTSIIRRSNRPRTSISPISLHQLPIRCLVKHLGQSKTLAILNKCLADRPRVLERECRYVLSTR